MDNLKSALKDLFLCGHDSRVAAYDARSRNAELVKILEAERSERLTIQDVLEFERIKVAELRQAQDDACDALNTNAQIVLEMTHRCENLEQHLQDLLKEQEDMQQSSLMNAINTSTLEEEKARLAVADISTTSRLQHAESSLRKERAEREQLERCVANMESSLKAWKASADEEARRSSENESIRSELLKAQQFETFCSNYYPQVLEAWRTKRKSVSKTTTSENSVQSWEKVLNGLEKKSAEA